MPSEDTLSFDELVTYRQQLQKFCSAHYSSLIAFRDHISFKLNLSEPTLPPTASHPSSSATCFESLLECPEGSHPGRPADIPTMAKDFALSAIDRPDKNWLSEGSAPIYCRCRTLPLVVYHLPAYDSRLQKHLEHILGQLKRNVSRLAIGEASGRDQQKWHPPNAFHTYWTLYLLHALKERFPGEYDQLGTRYLRTRFNLDRLRQEMLLWSQQTAGHQVALHAAESIRLDSDQLAWSLAAILRFHDDFQAELAQQDFIRFALQCLFKQQTSVGIWRTGARLFHYQKSGNAYCYVFETFTVLLKAALVGNRKEGVFLRQVLRPYAPRLLKLWRYADSTQTPLPREGGMAWASGHRGTSKEPESWSTASVFSYAECLRRLLGIWTREEAASRFKPITPRVSSSGAIEKLCERGATWSARGRDAATQLMTLFVNPARSSPSADCLEPDSQPVLPNQARGAILFGPPGTSKTTLAECVARAIGWHYIEVHASDFVADGLPNVQRTANQIFERLVELDRTVVLFDEIDELVRAREKEHDAFGRFLTTSMLPKLAELWKRRKVIYFIATNHISFFDPAVIRAERFDALIHVSPPSLERKLDRLESLLRGRSLTVASVALTHEEVEQALQCAGKACPKRAGSGADAGKHDSDNTEGAGPLPEGCILAKFLLMRWDQLEELASRIVRRSEGTDSSLRLDRRALERALADISDPHLSDCRPFREYAQAIQYEQHDFSKECVWEVRGNIPNSETAQFRKAAGGVWYVFRGDFGELDKLPRACRVAAPGVLEWPGEPGEK